MSRITGIITNKDESLAVEMMSLAVIFYTNVALWYSVFLQAVSIENQNAIWSIGLYTIAVLSFLFIKRRNIFLSTFIDISIIHAILTTFGVITLHSFMSRIGEVWTVVGAILCTLATISLSIQIGNIILLRNRRIELERNAQQDAI